MASESDDFRQRHGALVHEIVRYLAAGAFSYGMGIALSAVFHEFAGVRQEIAVALSLTAIIITNFWIARKVIFRASGNAHGQFIRFASTSLIMRLLEYATFMLLLRKAGINYILSLTLAMAMSTCFKFLLYRMFVFRKTGMQ